MLKFLIVIAIFASLVAGSGQKFRIVNGQQIGTIVNGKVHNPGNFPYVVYLRIIRHFTHGGASFITSTRCGGSIIRGDLILTAAHCVKAADPKDVTAFAGIVHIAKEQPSAQFIRGRRIVVHAHYQKPWKHDIALVFLVNSFDMSAHVDTITLGRPFHYQGGMNVTAVGWGRDVDGISTAWLQRGDFVMMDRTTCAWNIGYDRYDELLCAIDPNLSMKVCSGDSGGPLVSNNVLVGISVGTFEPLKLKSGSCDPREPAVFTNVSHYRDWIDIQITNDNMYYI